MHYVLGLGLAIMLVHDKNKSAGLFISTFVRRSSNVLPLNQTLKNHPSHIS